MAAVKFKNAANCLIVQIGFQQTPFFMN